MSRSEWNFYMANIARQLHRIKKELLECKEAEISPCMTESEVEAFERKHRIRLPQEYRRFLLEVTRDVDCMRGNATGDMLYWKHAKYLDKPFPFTQTWQREYDEEGEYLESDPTDQEVTQGTITVYLDGCGISYGLVVTGEARGQVWMIDFSCDQIVRPFRIDPKKRGFLNSYDAYLSGALWDDPDFDEQEE